jgi:hypothetical protein
MIKIEFEFVYEDQMFRDAIVLPDDHGLSDEEIEAIKQKRFDDWKESIKPESEEDQ